MTVGGVRPSARRTAAIRRSTTWCPEIRSRRRAGKSGRPFVGVPSPDCCSPDRSSVRDRLVSMRRRSLSASRAHGVGGVAERTVLRSDHPLLRATEAIHYTGRQWVRVAAVLAGSVIPRIEGREWAGRSTCGRAARAASTCAYPRSARGGGSRTTASQPLESRRSRSRT